MSFYQHYASRERIGFGVRLKKTFARKLFDLSTKGLTHPVKIMEIGPGDGYIAELAVKNGCEYLGIEGSSEVVGNLTAQGYRIIESFVPPLPETNEKFHVCFLLHVIEHMNSIGQAEQLLSGIRQHLHENGKIIIAFPDYIFWGKDFFNCDYTHNLPFTLKRISQLLQNSGFSINFANHYVGNIFGIKGFPIYWIARIFYFRRIDAMMKNSLHKDLWYRGFLTFIPNILVIASVNNKKQ